MKSRLKVALVAPLYESVPPTGYGGTELVVALIARGLKELGHHVTLFASGDSKAKADRRISVHHKSIRLDASVKMPLALMLAEVDEVRKHAHEFDIIHNHIDMLGFSVSRTSTTPVVTTMHGKLFAEEQHKLYKRFDNIGFISISKNQRSFMPDLNWIATVYNGIDLSNYKFNAGNREDYLLFLSRISPEKDPLAAIEVAKRTGLKLKIVAKIDKVDQEYFESRVKPKIDGRNVELIGEVSLAEKAKLYAKAKALIFPINWPEPFGLVMIEAAAAGTPVIARPMGSAPEVIADGVTGYLERTVAGMVRAVKNLDKIDPLACRKRAEEFSYKVMTERYLAAYRKIIARVKK